MVRAPCCDKAGLKKGPWTTDEDQMLVAHISRYGHANWRVLPKQAGLLRCGKSCRLRWTNYLRPDIKRGNYSKEEEEMIVSLHEKLGNRWSAIAARLPGRTDNEIKNVWHTHIKKRLKQNDHAVDESKGKKVTITAKPVTLKANQMEVEPKQMLANNPMSPEWSDISSSGTDFSSMTVSNNASIKDEYCMFDIDESFWSDQALSMDQNSDASTDVPISASTMINEPLHAAGLPKDDDGMNFWLSILMEAGDFERLA